jgi:uroporphyrinogen-III synthase
MRALVTRPRADAALITAELKARGFEVLLEPLIEIAPRAGATLAFDGVQGLLATSANGVRALADKTTRRDLPLWAVGDATGAEARRLGFAQVESAAGDVTALASLVAARVDPKRGALLHAAGSVQAGDLTGSLESRGFTVRRAVLYDARPAEALSAELAAALRADRLDIALFFSPRTAAGFVRLARAADLGDSCGGMTGYALSGAVAQALDAHSWRALRVAHRPTQDALLAALDEDLAAGALLAAGRKNGDL